MSDRERYPKSEYQKAVEYNRARDKIAAQRQERAHGALDVNALRNQANELALGGTLPGSLPVIHDRMSEADMNSAQARMNQLRGFSLTESRDPRLAPPAGVGIGSRTGTPLPRPVGAPQAASPLDRLPKIQLRGSTPAEIAKFKAADATSVSEATAREAAGTGKVVKNPYGTGSSTVVKAGTPEQPATVTDTGVVRDKSDPWDVALVKKYPQIGIAGTPENKAFVEKYKAFQAQASADPNSSYDMGANGHRIADELFKPKDMTYLDPATVAKAKASGEKQAALTAQNVDLATKGALAGGATPPTPATGPEAVGAAITAPIGKAIAGTGITSPEAFAGEYVQPLKDLGSVAVGLGKGVLGMPPASTPGPTRPSLLTGGLQASDFGFGPPKAAPYTAPAATAGASAGGYSPMDTLPTWKPPTSSKPTASNSQFDGWQPDEDSQAFAQNPEEDQFRKKMREPSQLQYSA